MSAYPGLPDNRLVVNGVDLSETYRLVLLDGYTLTPPSPKTYTVDIPGGNGVIDVTEAMTGDVAYDNRTMEFEFAVIDVEDFEKTKTKVSNFLHGRKYSYTMTMDPGYTYTGRFTVSSYSHEAYANGIVGTFKVKIDANPYKVKEAKTYKLNATGGKLFRLESGRRPVHPTIECTEPCWFSYNGKHITVPAGTYRLNEIELQSGVNEVWVNTRKFWDITWSEIGEQGIFSKTWENLSAFRWDEIQMLGQSTEEHIQAWSDLSETKWSDISGETKHWYDLNYTKNVIGDSVAYVQYNWEDL